MKKILSLLVLILITFQFSFSQDVNANEKGKALDNYFAKALNDWEVPGMAIGIVKDDKVVLASGYGFCELGKDKLVDANTVFPIASNTKAFTATALAFLVDEGRISWEDKVRTHLPYFELYDPYVSNNMTIRDLLSHRSGLKTFSGDLVWYGTTYSREEVVKRARFLKQEYGFREHFGYQNIMFIAAGEVVPAVTGTSWDDFLKQRIFSPLEMNSTNVLIHRLHFE